MIRLAKKEDIPTLNKLLFQVNQVHFLGRPDIFKSAVKYTNNELDNMLDIIDQPIFVYEKDQNVIAYAFCKIEITSDNQLLKDRRSLYIDDLCVDENYRHQGIGKEMYQYLKTYAKERVCDTITLNVWALNNDAYAFYQKMGLIPLKTIMEDKLDGE